MTKSKKKSPEGATYSSWQVLNSANSYYALSTGFTLSLPRSLRDVEKSFTGMEGATASATNRILALELYIKAYLVGAEVSVPFEHDLKLLFDLL